MGMNTGVLANNSWFSFFYTETAVRLSAKSNDL